MQWFFFLNIPLLLQGPSVFQMHGLWTRQVSLMNGENLNRKETHCRHACKSLSFLMQLTYQVYIFHLIFILHYSVLLVDMQQQVHVLMVYSFYVVEEMPVVWYVDFDPEYSQCSATFAISWLLVDAVYC